MPTSNTLTHLRAAIGLGQRFNRLTLLRKMRVRSGKRSLRGTLCRCDCGSTLQVTLYNLTSGNTKSCGCYKRERSREVTATRSRTHGLSKHPLYQTWSGMLSRCYNQKKDNFIYYGGRGISVCEQWHELLRSLN